MDIHDFRCLALSLPGAEESSHMGSPDFRVGGRIFATLAAAKLGYGNIMITPEQQSAFVAELPEIFIPVPGGWGRGGATHVNLAAANEDVVLGALQTAHKLRVEKNAATGSKSPAAKSKTKHAQKSKPIRTLVAKRKSSKTKPRRSNTRSKK
jgi:YjbR